MTGGTFLKNRKSNGIPEDCGCTGIKVTLHLRSVNKENKRGVGAGRERGGSGMGGGRRASENKY